MVREQKQNKKYLNMLVRAIGQNRGLRHFDDELVSLLADMEGSSASLLLSKWEINSRRNIFPAQFN